MSEKLHCHCNPVISHINIVFIVLFSNQNTCKKIKSLNLKTKKCRSMISSFNRDKCVFYSIEDSFFFF